MGIFKSLFLAFWVTWGFEQVDFEQSFVESRALVLIPKMFQALVWPGTLGDGMALFT